MRSCPCTTTASFDASAPSRSSLRFLPTPPSTATVHVASLPAIVRTVPDVRLLIADPLSTFSGFWRTSAPPPETPLPGVLRSVDRRGHRPSQPRSFGPWRPPFLRFAGDRPNGTPHLPTAESRPIGSRQSKVVFFLGHPHISARTTVQRTSQQRTVYVHFLSVTDWWGSEDAIGS